MSSFDEDWEAELDGDNTYGFMEPIGENYLDAYFSRELNLPTFSPRLKIIRKPTDNLGWTARWNELLPKCKMNKRLKFVLDDMGGRLNRSFVRVLNNCRSNELKELSLMHWIRGLRYIGGALGLRELRLISCNFWREEDSLGLTELLRETVQLSVLVFNQVNLIFLMNKAVCGALAANRSLRELVVKNCEFGGRRLSASLGRAIGSHAGLDKLSLILTDSVSMSEKQATIVWQNLLSNSASCSSLTTLEIQSEKPEDVLGHLPSFAGIRRLDFGFDNRMNALPQEFVDWLGGLTDLSIDFTFDDLAITLRHLERIRFGSDAFAPVDALIHNPFPNLTSLELCVHDEEDLNKLAGLQAPSLRHLAVANRGFANHKLRCNLSTFIETTLLVDKWPSLERLKVLNSYPDEDDMMWSLRGSTNALERYFRARTNSRSGLKHLELPLSPMRSEADSISFIRGLKDNQSLQSMRFGKCDKASARAFCETLPTMTSLETFELGKSSKDAKVVSRLADACTRSRTLKRFWFGRTHFVDESERYESSLDPRDLPKSFPWPCGVDNDDDVFGCGFVKHKHVDFLTREIPFNALRFSKLSFFGLLWAVFAKADGLDAFGDNPGQDGNDQLKSRVFYFLWLLDRARP